MNKKIILSAFLFSNIAFASPYDYQDSPIDTASDMLKSNQQSENENADSSSQWGTSASKVRAQNMALAHPIAPIDESSFEVDRTRAPASVREPAGVAQTQVTSRTKPLPSAKTMVRELRQKKAYQEMSVIVNDLGFFPSTLFATQGIPVRLFVTGASLKSQCIILDEFGVRRQIRSNKVEEIIFTPDHSGKFAFNCPMNGARGAIVVKELELDRIPATQEPVHTSMAPPALQVQPTNNVNHNTINDQDFGPEFRLQ